ncbi:hypothetical protein [Veronia pacifica]|uniref:Uncharacterized protein n=1 Tax=Veronia pacifica TaxID=1080227 RepID=A0A1C3ER50_9GAMM|nr:hypothetical protein [Veronia pacifica]ODA35679.1 hypothetical protein A8L45_03430 [Veronia pacifica]
MTIDHITTEDSTALNPEQQQELKSSPGQFEWSMFWCRPWIRLHGSWASVLDTSLIEDSIAEAMHYDEILETLKIDFAPEPEIVNPLSLSLATIAPDIESRVFSFVSAILTDGHVAGDLNEDERIWCFRFAAGLNLHQYGDTHRDTVISILQDETQHPVAVLSALLIRSWAVNDPAFWTRYRVRFDKDIRLPESNLLISPAKLNYVMKTALFMAEQNQPVAKQIPELTDEQKLQMKQDTEKAQAALVS